jgi:hypothetical protein
MACWFERGWGMEQPFCWWEMLKIEDDWGRNGKEGCFAYDLQGRTV